MNDGAVRNEQTGNNLRDLSWESQLRTPSLTKLHKEVQSYIANEHEKQAYVVLAR